MPPSSSIASTGQLIRPNFWLFQMPKLYSGLPILRGFQHQLVLQLCLTECWQSVTSQLILEAQLSSWMNAQQLTHHSVYTTQIETRIQKG